MRGTPPKDPALRQRRNRKSSAAKLRSDPDLEVPPLPMERAWCPETIAEWVDIWESPMAPQFIDADFHGLLKLAVLIDDFWTVESANARAKLAVEIRLQRADFGLNPISRNRLHWEIDRGEQARERSEKRKARQETPPPTPESDPRAVLGRQGGLVALPGGRST